MNPTFDAAGLTVLERGWLSSNSVLFDGRGRHESVLIDSGYWTHATQTVALVKLILGESRLDRVVNTHLHSDHCGGNQALQQSFDCAIDIPAGEAGKVDHWDEDALSYRATGQHCPRFRRTGLIRCGSAIWLGERPWQVVATPGHDPESVALYQPELQVLISADALWENGFGVVFPELDGEDGFGDVRRTLEQIGKLKAQWIIPGHGAPFQGLDEAIDRAQRRLDVFIREPQRHARHAAKVLIKFHLLEVQRQRLAEFLIWFESTTCLKGTHAKYFESIPIREWCMALIQELATVKVISINGEIIHNF